MEAHSYRIPPSGDQVRELNHWRVMQRVAELAGGDCSAEVRAARLAHDLDLSLGEVFAIVEFLCRFGLLEYRGAGPRLCLTQAALLYLQSHRPPGVPSG